MISMKRPSRGLCESATTMRKYGAFLRPVRRRRMRTMNSSDQGNGSCTQVHRDLPSGEPHLDFPAVSSGISSLTNGLDPNGALNDKRWTGLTKHAWHHRGPAPGLIGHLLHHLLHVP